MKIDPSDMAAKPQKRHRSDGDIDVRALCEQLEAADNLLKAARSSKRALEARDGSAGDSLPNLLAKAIDAYERARKEQCVQNAGVHHRRRDGERLSTHGRRPPMIRLKPAAIAVAWFGVCEECFGSWWLWREKELERCKRH